VLALADGLPPVSFSRQDLQHIVLNLVVNSLEAMDERGGRIEISTRPLDGGALLAVEDDGPGIRPDLLAKVQEPFFSTKHGGTGLGLAICRRWAPHQLPLSPHPRLDGNPRPQLGLGRRPHREGAIGR
jgi:signal transduction histidine kinase